MAALYIWQAMMLSLSRVLIKINPSSFGFILLDDDFYLALCGLILIEIAE